MNSVYFDHKTKIARKLKQLNKLLKKNKVKKFSYTQKNDISETSNHSFAF